MIKVRIDKSNVEYLDQVCILILVPKYEEKVIEGIYKLVLNLLHFFTFYYDRVKV